MLDIAQTLFFTLIALGVLVTFHEFGHFWVARLCGVKVLRFSIGFGTPLVRWHDKKGTEFVISALPLGGYVKMLGERDDNIDPGDLPYAFNRKPVFQRIAIVAAGPLANFLLAIFFYWFVFLSGVQGLAPIVDSVKPGSVAEAAGLEHGQEIIAVDGEPTPTLKAVMERLVLRLGEQDAIHFTVKYPDSNLSYHLETELNGWQVDADNPDPIRDIGIEIYAPTIPPLVDQVVAGEAAAKAGFKSGDLIVSMDGQPVAEWSQWVDYVRSRPGQSIAVEVQRDGEIFFLQLTPASVEEGSALVGKVGMAVKVPPMPEDMIRTMEYGVAGAFLQGIRETWKTTVMVLDSIKKMITGIISPKHLSGPITIAKVAGASAQYGVSAYISFLALLSVSLGVLNLLPVPVLDGGHLMYYIIEAAKGSPVSEKIQEVGYRVGLFLVVGLMVIALYNDVMRL